MNNIFLKNRKKENEVIKSKKISFFSLGCLIIAILSHLSLVLVVINSYQYYNIYPSLFGNGIGIIVCVLIIIDIIAFVGINNKDIALKIVSITLSFFILIGGTVGTYYLMKVNEAVNVIMNDGKDSYEMVSGVFTTYNSNKINSLEKINGKKVGFIKENEDGIAFIAKEKLAQNNIEYETKEYTNTINLLFSLVEGNVDVAVFPYGYDLILSSDENNEFTKYIDDLNDFEKFEGQVKIENNINKKNIAKDSFNVLLIGWSRVEIGSSIGLADAIIVATVNPQTYTVSMMSIPRDSYVDIPCYGNTKDKVNSGRSSSRACFINTVEQMLDTEMDFYMEIDYQAIVNVVNTIGGIQITNTTEFTLDGQYMPVGTWVADGYQILQYVRERHAFTGGDFARQEHQKEVIMKIVEKLLYSKDVSLALKALNSTEGYLSTNLTVQQLTTIFNMLLNTKNYTSLPIFDLLDFQTMKLSGYASYHYSYDYYLPLWIYKLYDSSIMECVDRIKEIEEFSSTSNQKTSFVFSINNPYNRLPFYSDDFNEEEIHEQMPPYYVDLTSMTYEEAIEWADENKVNLDFVYIEPYDSEYVAELDGMVVGQSVRYGKLISDNPNCTITIMGSHGVPNFVGKDIDVAKEWCKEHDIDYEKIAGEPYESKEDYKIIYKQKYDEDEEIVYLYYYGEPADVELAIESGQEKCGSIEGDGIYSINGTAIIKAIPADGYSFKGWYDSDNKLVSEEEEYKFTVEKKTKLIAKFYKDISSFVSVNYVTGSTDSMGSVSKALNADNSVTISAEAKQGYVFKGWYSDNAGSNKITGDKSYKITSLSDKKTYYAKFAECEHSYDDGVTTTQPTCTSEGVLTKTCTKCGAVKQETIPIDPNSHDFQEVYEAETLTGYKCSRCGAEKGVE